MKFKIFKNKPSKERIIAVQQRTAIASQLHNMGFSIFEFKKEKEVK